MQRDSSQDGCQSMARWIAPVKALSISPSVAKNGSDRTIARLIFYYIRETAKSYTFQCLMVMPLLSAIFLAGEILG